MYRLVASYAHPQDPDAFLEHRRAKHVPLICGIPGLRSFEQGVCETADGTDPPRFLTAACDWESTQHAIAAFESETGARAETTERAHFAQPSAPDIEFMEVVRGC